MNKPYLNLVIAILICQIATLLIGIKISKTQVVVSYLNAIVVIGILIFWVSQNLNLQQHYFEFREAFVLCLEACILIFALYSILGFQNNTLKTINYIGFALHLLAAVGLLVFILTFKITKLF